MSGVNCPEYIVAGAGGAKRIGSPCCSAGFSGSIIGVVDGPNVKCGGIGREGPSATLDPKTFVSKGGVPVAVQVAAVGKINLFNPRYVPLRIASSINCRFFNSSSLSG